MNLSNTSRLPARESRRGEEEAWRRKEEEGRRREEEQGRRKKKEDGEIMSSKQYNQRGASFIKCGDFR